MIRVGVAGPLGPDLFASNVLESLPDLGVDAVGLGQVIPQMKGHYRRAGMELTVKSVARLGNRFAAQWTGKALAAECDLVITVIALPVQSVAELRRAGVEVALWFPDHLGNLGRNLMFATDYSRLYFKDSLVAERVADIQGLPTAYLPEACNPRWHRPQGGRPGDDPVVVLAGNLYPTRARLLERMANDGIPLQLYGGHLPPWLPQRDLLAPVYAGREIYQDEKAQVFRRATAVLNNLHPSELTSMNARLFEATGSGAAVLTEYRPALDDLYDQETEVLTFATYDELLTQWRRLVDNPDLGRHVGDAAAKRAHAEHTYQHRLQKVLTDLL